MKKRLLITATTSLLLTLQPFFALAMEPVRPEFNPNVIIPDSAFNDTQTFGSADGIQRFLEAKRSILANTSPEFTVKLNEPNSATLKEKLGDPQPNLGRVRTAAELIWDAAQSSGLNPQIILVTMNKEQGLIGSETIDPARLDRALNFAMGFNCPSNAGCGNLFPGFYYQLFGNVDTEGNRYIGAAKSLAKSFNTPGGRGPDINGAPSRIGQSITIQNTVGSYLGVLKEQIVTLSNAATAALYRYTPHVFNGNYNFWKFFSNWFKYPNGTLLRTLADHSLFIVQDGSRRLVPNFVAAERKLNLAAIITASPTELVSYPLGPVYGPTDNTIVNLNGNTFVFIDGAMHPVSSFVLKERKLDPTKTLAISAADASLFTIGTQLTPNDGTVLKGETNPNVYLVSKGVLKLYSPFTFRQHDAAKLLQIIPDTEIALYPKLGYVLPKNGTLIKGEHSDNLYLVGQSQRLPLTNELFKNLGFKKADVVTLSSDAELASIPLGAPATPREGTYFAIKDSTETYLFKDGEKHPLYSYVIKQRRITPSYYFEASIVSNWPDGIAVPPLDGTLVKSDSTSTVYIVENGQLHALTFAIFQNRGLSFKKVVTLPANQIDALPKGGFAEPRDNTYFDVAGTGEFYLFKDKVKRIIFPLVAKQKYMTPDFTFSAEVVSTWNDGVPIAPLNGTLIEGDAATTVYVVMQNKLRALSPAAFKRLGYREKNIKIIPQKEVDALPKGEPITK